MPHLFRDKPKNLDLRTPGPELFFFTTHFTKKILILLENMESEINDPFKKDELFTKSSKKQPEDLCLHRFGACTIPLWCTNPTGEVRAFPEQALQAQLSDPQCILHLVTLCFSSKGRKIRPHSYTTRPKFYPLSINQPQTLNSCIKKKNHSIGNYGRL